jgi:hypothetical protein
MNDASPTPTSSTREVADNEALAQRCEAVAGAAVGAIDWLASAAELVGDQAAGMARDFRREARRARKLAAAARRPMCVSVFGPSQQGKSYLVGSLARKNAKAAMIRFGDETRDFVVDLNPDGTKESTGLVTRFTVRPVPTLPGMPVAFRMLSQTDIIKIMANAFMEDFNRDTVTELAPEAIEATLAKLRKRAAREPVDGFGEDDVYDLFEYFERYFRNHPSHAALKPNTWREMEGLAPRLAIADRVELFGLLWNGTPTMTRVATLLIQALATLGFPDEAFSPLAAVIPKQTSVIDVQTMATLGQPGGETVTVATRGGARVELARPVLTAIIAELQLQLAEKPFDFFDHTDLLDFPGARPRGEENAQEAEKEAARNIYMLFRRGKVAYLYQRYLAEQELTSMLLCLKPGNQDTPTVPHMVNDWIAGTHGATAEARASQDVALFLVYTWFDAEFGLKAGQKDDSVERWSIRFETTLHSFLGKSHEWVEDWAGGKPFNNTFWLRNPTVFDKGLIDYDAANVEIGFRDPQRLAMLRGNYLANPDVQRYVADPGRAWDAAMVLNDGGIAFIAERLAPMCNPAVKRRQVSEQLKALAARFRSRLEPLHVSDNREAELLKRRDEARQVGRQLLACAQSQAFGLLLRELQVVGEDLAGLFRKEQLAAADGPSVISAPLGRRTTARALHDDFDATFDDETFAAAPAAQSADEAELIDVPDMLARSAVTNWLDQINRFAERADVPALFQIERECVAFLVGQLAAAARRLRLRETIAQHMRDRAAYQERLSDRMVKPVMIAERRLNDFVTWLGFDALPIESRPRAGRDRRPVFVHPDAAEEFPPLGETPAAYDSNFYIDWASSFVRLVEDNVRGADGRQADNPANKRLGEILGALRTAL